jgi:fatty acid desaturase
MQKTGLYDEKTTLSDVIFYILSIPSPSTTFKHIRYLIQFHLLPAGEAWTETIARAAYWTAVISIVIKAGALTPFCLYWLVPLVTTANWVMSILDMLEHFPLMTKVDEQVDIKLSRNRFLTGLERFFLGIHCEGYHLVHHLWPKMPCWHFHQAHEIMMADEEYRRCNVHREGVRPILEMIFAFFE